MDNEQADALGALLAPFHQRQARLLVAATILSTAHAVQMTAGRQVDKKWIESNGLAAIEIADILIKIERDNPP